ELTNLTAVTGLGSLVGTLEYMSPEQAGFNPVDLDTRTDVYSLGVLLYELLTGSTPFPRKNPESSELLAVLQQIREQDPPRPSVRLSSSPDLPTLAANRATEPKRLVALVRGDLDWIVMKALEKDRSCRYQTASDLGRNIQLSLAGEPVDV